MKNVTVSLDDETYRRGRMRAAERGASLSALVREFLDQLGGTETEFERLRREEARLRGQVSAFEAANREGRDALHGRGGH